MVDDVQVFWWVCLRGRVQAPINVKVQKDSLQGVGLGVWGSEMTALGDAVSKREEAEEGLKNTTGSGFQSPGQKWSTTLKGGLSSLNVNSL